MKYALPETVIHAQILKTKYSVDIILKNIGISLKTDDEEYSIFNEGVRGSNAHELDVDGKGQGLHISRLYAEVNDGEITLSIKKLDERKSEYTFIVSFPKTKIEKI